MINGVVGHTHAEASPRRSRRPAQPPTAAPDERQNPSRRLKATRASTTAGQHPARSAGTAPATAARCSQRQRLLDAITDLAVRDGYAAATVGEIVALAGVSRPTFYAYFADKEDCFLQALAPIRHRLLDDLAAAVGAEPPQDATKALTVTLVSFAASQPSTARLLMSDPLAGGRRVMDARDELITQAALLLEDAFQRAPARAMIPDLPPGLLIGVVCRLIACRLRDGEPRLTEILHEILDWLAAYELPAGEHRWRTLAPVAPLARSPFLAPTALRAPPALAPGRQRITEDAVSENHWLRVVFATAEVVARDGYVAATVAEIVRLAGVDGRVFYTLFASKQQALAAARELFFRHAMAVTAGAFAAGETWPECLWEAARALTQSVEQSPTLSHVSFVESHSGGPLAMRRLEELACAFTIFLQEGYRYEPARRPGSHAGPSRLAQEAIITSVFELCYLQAREHGGPALSAHLGHVVFVSLAPFLGADAANDFLDQKASAGRGDTHPPGRAASRRARRGSRAAAGPRRQTVAPAPRGSLA
jgi:AcrR family transcriptional regulator